MAKKGAEEIIGSVGRGVLNTSYGAHSWRRVTERTPGVTRLVAMSIARRGDPD